MFYLSALSLVAIATGYIFNCLPIAFGMIALFALIGLPIIGRLEARR